MRPCTNKCPAIVQASHLRPLFLEEKIDRTLANPSDNNHTRRRLNIALQQSWISKTVCKVTKLNLLHMQIANIKTNAITKTEGMYVLNHVYGIAHIWKTRRGKSYSAYLQVTNVYESRKHNNSNLHAQRNILLISKVTDL